MDEFQSPYVLKLLADQGAAAAVDAFAGIEHDGGGGGVAGENFEFLAERLLADAEVLGQFLKLTASVSGACKTFVGVAGLNQLDDSFSDFHEFGIVSDVILPLRSRQSHKHEPFWDCLPPSRHRYRRPPMVQDPDDNREWGILTCADLAAFRILVPASTATGFPFI